MNRILIVLGIFALFFSCDKTKDDLSGTSEIKGKLFIENLYINQPKKEMPNQTVYIKYDGVDSSTNTYLYSVKTDSLGFFLFTNLRDDKSYILFSQITKSTLLDSNVVYSVYSKISAPFSSVELKLTVDSSKQNILYLNATDSTGFGTIPFDTVYLYTSRVLAVNDTGNLKGIGASYKFITNNNGSFFKTDIIPDSLFINSYVKFDTLRLQSLLDVIVPQKSGLITKKIKLSRK